MALQIMSGRMTYEMFLNEPYERIGFGKPCCKSEMLAMAENVIFDNFEKIYFK